MDKQILVYRYGDSNEESAEYLRDFDVCEVDNLHACLAALETGDYHVLLIDQSRCQQLDLKDSRILIERRHLEGVPLVILSPEDALRFKLEAFELGCDDFITSSLAAEEICARIGRAIYHHIANMQLNSRLNQANSAAYSMMTDNSNLGANIQFLLNSSDCDNLDQLGALFFNSITHYGLSCSLQMRSVYGDKNMDANGMSRDLESQLLSHMKGQGRYVDFGRRTIVNYGHASLLVRNMPVDDSDKYGALKDNLVILVQGLDTRIRALDEHQRVLDEKQALHKLSSDVQEVMKVVDSSYQKVMRNIVGVVEDLAESVELKIPTLSLTEEQEAFLERLASDSLARTQRTFTEGLQVDECFRRLSSDLSSALARTERIDAHERVNQALVEDSTNVSSDGLF